MSHPRPSWPDWHPPSVTSVEGPETAARRERFEAVAALVTEPVRRFLARRTDAETADDALADTLLVCWRRLDDVPDGEEALPWAYAVARNALANAERGQRRQRRLAYRITVVDPPSESAPGAEEPDDMLEELERDIPAGV